MEYADHAYTDTSYDIPRQTDFTYKLSKQETEDFVKLRVSNNYLFSGKRNTSMWAWRAILRHMGLHQLMTHRQASKKWENMKMKYKELKYPPQGVTVVPETWSFFSLMDNAMSGRLQGSAPILKSLSNSKDDRDFLIAPKKSKVSSSTAIPPAVSSEIAEIEISLNGDEEVAKQESIEEVDCQGDEIKEEWIEIDSEQQVPERERELMERERLVLQRERAVLDREIAVLDRDRAVLERERATLEREKAVVERERVMVEKDREAVNRDRLALEQEREWIVKHETKRRTEEDAENSSISNTEISALMGRKEQLIYLFEKFVKSL
ncbi:uncharacterized protein KZ484_020170 isoform 2-T2 [Pholidichthys leucotaenia]